MGLRGALVAVLSRGSLDGLSLAKVHPELLMGSEFEPTETASAGVPDEPAPPGSAKPPLP